MKKVLLTMASLVMLVSMTFAQNETPMLPVSHGLTEHQPAWLTAQTFDLASGWNWWSTYINVSGTEGLTALETVLGENGLTIKAASSFVSNEGGWSGLLTSIENTSMYAIQVAEDDEISLSGTRAIITNMPIALQGGWNWVGYPVPFEMPTAYALSNYTDPQDGEVFKTLGPFVQYDAELGWIGSLDVVQPGKGYKLQRLGTDFTFYYPTVPASKRAFISSQDATTTEWQPMQASNPNNMNMVAVVSLDDNELRGEDVEIGVFNGETCRGAGRLIYVEALDQYLAFLTMYGEENEPFSFRLLNHETNTVYESNEASVSFNADKVIGKVRNPFELKFNSNGHMTAGTLQLFPNPVNRGENVNLALPENSMTVEVVNVLGSTVKTMRVAQGSNQLSADMAPGIYTIKVTDAQGKMFVDKLVVK